MFLLTKSIHTSHTISLSQSIVSLINHNPYFAHKARSSISSILFLTKDAPSVSIHRPPEPPSETTPPPELRIGFLETKDIPAPCIYYSIKFRGFAFTVFSSAPSNLVPITSSTWPILSTKGHGTAYGEP